MMGYVDQYFGKSKEVGATISNIFKMDDGRTIISVRTINKDIFTMTTLNLRAEKEYVYRKNEYFFVKLLVSHNYITGIESSGEWDCLSEACWKMLNHEKISDDLLNIFSTTGDLVHHLMSPYEGEIICSCLSIHKRDILKLIENGVDELDTISKETGAGSICGSCQYRILDLLGKNLWLSADIELEQDHHAYIKSYLITPHHTPFKHFLPGQYLVIQAKVGENWIERAYTISGKKGDALRISVKNNDGGLFGNWLFEQKSKKAIINVAQPQGLFTLNYFQPKPTICFAEGIGITPFISFAKELSELKIHKRLHIQYCVEQWEEFIFMDEFDEICQNNRAVTVSYYETNQKGLITEEHIKKLIFSVKDPEIYICGSAHYEAFITSTLRKIDFDQNKIFIEKFG